MTEFSSLLLADTWMVVVFPLVALLLGAGIVAVIWVVLNQNSKKKCKKQSHKSGSKSEITHILPSCLPHTLQLPASKLRSFFSF